MKMKYRQLLRSEYSVCFIRDRTYSRDKKVLKIRRRDSSVARSLCTEPMVSGSSPHPAELSL